jgi:hypothetical protein
MSVNFTLTSKTRVDTFKDVLSIGDVVKYSIDCTPWVEDNETITAATWTSLSGSVGISDEANVAGVVSANIAATQAGTSQVSILLETASGLAKKIWLNLRVKDQDVVGDDYGLNDR